MRILMTLEDLFANIQNKRPESEFFTLWRFIIIIRD